MPPVLCEKFWEEAGRQQIAEGSVQTEMVLSRANFALFWRMTALSIAWR